MTRAIRFVGLSLLAISAGALVLAQQVHPPGAGQINTQVNTELYGGGTPASVRYAQAASTSRAMESEVRHAYYQSGSTPSDVRMGFAALGPMHPQGPMAYIPPKDPNYMPKPYVAPPSPMGSYGAGSVRYSSPAGVSSSAYMGSTSLGTTAISPSLVSSGPINAGPINTGAIRYSR